jgi:hypothetical protein
MKPNTTFHAVATLVALRAANALDIVPCAASDTRQQWSFAGAGGPAPIKTPQGDQCVAVAIAGSACNVSSSSALGIAPCSTGSPCGGAEQGWVLDGATGFLYSALPAGDGSDNKFCITLAAVSGPGVNLWPCSNASPHNGQWTYNSPAPGLFQTQDGAVGVQCLHRPASPTDPIVLNGSVAGRVWQGVGGLAAIGEHDAGHGVVILLLYTHARCSQAAPACCMTTRSSRYVLVPLLLCGSSEFVCHTQRSDVLDLMYAM